MKDGFLKAAALSPALRVADCAYNVRQITEALRKAAARGVKLAVFPPDRLYLRRPVSAAYSADRRAGRFELPAG